MVLDTVLPKVAVMLVEAARDRVVTILGVPGEMRKLTGTLDLVNRFLEDAERKRLESRVTERWLKELQDAVYDADDISDLWKIRNEEDHSAAAAAAAAAAAGEPSVRCHDFLSSACLPFVYFFRKTALSHEIGNKIKDLNLKLQGIAREMDTCGLVELDPGHSLGVGVDQDTSHVLGLDIVGTKIEDDTEELVEFLTRPNTTVANAGATPVLAIVGIGGIGKTTLAQKIINDEKIKNGFDLKVWACVSQDLKPIKLVRDIIVGAGGDHENEESMSILIPKLGSTLSGKRLLLVLDDVWDENLWERWLRAPVGRAAAVGSSVIVTSRNTSVAQQMRAIRTHNVELLSLEDGWSLLSKKVVEEEEEIEGLKGVGKQIVEKCGGLPLAIAALGGLLCKKERTSNAWEGVLHSTSWSVDGLPEEINRALCISYLELPLELKRCFLFLSPFPKGSLLEMDRIVGMWIAEGLIKFGGEYPSLEEVGQSYFKELISRSLLQPIPSHKKLTCVMHDLLRLLAQFLTQGESLCIEQVNMQSSSSTAQHKLRHLSVFLSSSGAIRVNNLLGRQHSLRTLMVFNAGDLQDDLFSRVPRLRVLNLHFPGEQELPDSLLGQVYLRYLDLSASRITKLPDKLGNLKNLRFLLLRYCSSLVGLPRSVVELPNLRRLTLPTPKRAGGGVPVPVGVGRLESLRCLEGFEVQPNDPGGEWSSLGELQHLSHLTKLTVYGLERVSDCNIARAAAIGRKSRLKYLRISCTESWLFEEVTEEDTKRVEEVFEVLRPPPSIETLKINYYPGCMPPSWISVSAVPAISSFPNLTRIKLLGWTNCKKLPALGQLPNLAELQISNAHSVESIGSEFMGSCSSGGAASVFFPKLKELHFSDMISLKSWAWAKEVRALSSLQKLTFSDCDLEAIPEGLHVHATSLTHLVLSGVGHLKSVTHLASLKSLDVTLSHCLTEISDCQSLKTLTVTDCVIVAVVKNLPSLQTVKLTGDRREIDRLPDWLGEEGMARPSRMLEIEGCSLGMMERMVCQEDGLRKIQHIDHVNIYSMYKKKYAIYTRTPYSFNTNHGQRRATNATSSSNRSD